MWLPGRRIRTQLRSCRPPWLRRGARAAACRPEAQPEGRAAVATGCRSRAQRALLAPCSTRPAPVQHAACCTPWASLRRMLTSRPITVALRPAPRTLAAMLSPQHCQGWHGAVLRWRSARRAGPRPSRTPGSARSSRRRRAAYQRRQTPFSASPWRLPRTHTATLDLSQQAAASLMGQRRRWRYRSKVCLQGCSRAGTSYWSRNRGSSRRRGGGPSRRASALQLARSWRPCRACRAARSRPG